MLVHHFLEGDIDHAVLDILMLIKFTDYGHLVTEGVLQLAIPSSTVTIKAYMKYMLEKKKMTMCAQVQSHHTKWSKL